MKGITKASLSHHEKEAPSMMTRYVREASCFPLLSREREIELARQIHEQSQLWRDMMQHRLVHVPLILDYEARLRSGEMPLSAVWATDHSPSRAEMILLLDHLQRLCGQLQSLAQQQPLHPADVTIPSTVAALRADMRALLRPWSYQSEFLHQGWTELDQAMVASSASRSCRSVDHFISILGYPLDDIHHWWQTLHGLHAEVKAAKEELITRNLRLVISLANRFHYTNVPLTDLIQEGNIGLMRAVETFDYRRNLKFSTYAFWWIKQRMRRAVMNQSALIRIPQYLHENVAQILRAEESLTVVLGRVPTAEEIAEHLGMPVERVERARAVAPPPISLDQNREPELTTSLHDSLPDTKVICHEEWLEYQDLSERIQSALERLTSRELEIIRRRFGMNGQPAESLRQVGLELQLSHERVRQIEAQALAKLSLTGNGLKDYALV